MKKLLICFVFLFFFPTNVFAHAGGGPPFVSVNGELAQTNPYYQGTSSINVPQDTLKAIFFPHQEITLSIDSSKLPIPSNIISQSEFSWIFFKGDNFLDQVGEIQKGQSITQTFTTPGSYLVNVYLSFEGDPQLLDTIQLNVVPSKDYMPPRLTIAISQFPNDMTRPITFTANPTLDKRSSVRNSFWDSGDGKLVMGKEFKHTYETSNFVSYIYHRVIDSEGLITDVGFQAQGVQGKISFVPFLPTDPTPFTLDILPSSNNISKTVLQAFIIVIVIVGMLVLFLKKGARNVR